MYLCSAYETLSDENKRKIYDSQGEVQQDQEKPFTNYANYPPN